MEDASKLSPEHSGPASKIEDVDPREILAEAPYVPPMEAQFANLLADSAVSSSVAEEENRTVAGVEKLFAEFQRQAYEYNASAETQLMLTVNTSRFDWLLD
ncbi:hypothetical protein BH10CYA1_BH10CYA1_46400 [soil metagenome]